MQNLRHGLRLNKRSGYCTSCGYVVAVGQGHIWQDQDTDEWLVAHNDATICQHNRAETANAEVEREAKKTALKSESDALQMQIVATGLALQADWSWDDYSYSLGAVLAETDHYQAREYRRSGTVVGFVIKERK